MTDQKNKKNSVVLSLRKRKNYFAITRTARCNCRKEILNKLSNFNLFLKSIGLQFKCVEIVKKNEEHDEDFEIKILDKTVTEFKNDTKSIVMDTLKACDESNLSERGYLGFKKNIGLPSMPSLAKLRMHKYRLNEFFDIEKNEYGNYVNVMQKIEYVLKKVYKKDPNLVKNDTFYLKFSGDGTNLTKSSVQLLNFTFTILNDKEMCKTSAGNYILGMFQINGEKYDELKGSLKEILEQIKELESIDVMGKTFKIKKFFAGDLKFLATMFGINPANSDYPCLWCTCNLKNILDVNAKWPITRTYKQALEKINLKTKEQRQGYVREPLIDFIDFDSVLIDTLHLLLRITDKLFDVLFKKFDTFDKSHSVDLNKRPTLKRFMNYLEVECSLTKPYYVSNGTKIKLRSLNGTERLKFLSKCFDNESESLKKLFPELDLNNESFVFKEFHDLFNTIKLYGVQSNQMNLIELETRLQIWLVAYSKLNESDNSITPYVHSFVFHMPEFLRKHNDINQFNMQGLEKLNDLATQYYHNSTNRNKKNNVYITQILAKRNRIEFFNLGGESNELDEKCPILSEKITKKSLKEIADTFSQILINEVTINASAPLSSVVASELIEENNIKEKKNEFDEIFERPQKKLKCSFY